MGKRRFLPGLVFAALALAGCSQKVDPAIATDAPAAPPSGKSAVLDDDERRVRDELALPPSAKVVTFSVDPKQGGFFGREGLRIVAMFELPRDAVEPYRARVSSLPGWSKMPLPTALGKFWSPPTELPPAPRGMGYCRTGVYRTGVEFDPHPCDGKRKIDQYRAAVFDPDTFTVTAVFKNYY